jgi:hypothetical protein
VDVVEKSGVINLPNGGFISTSPAMSATLTNGSDPSRSVTLNITGSFHVFNDGTVWIVKGRNLLGDPIAGLVLAIGNFSFVFDAAGNLIQPLTGTGELVDVCKLIS